MEFSSLTFSYRQKLWLSEFLYLFVLSVLIPLTVGLQIFDKLAYSLSLVLVNCLQVPAIILFYRWLLPFIFEKKRYKAALFLFPLYLVLYEVNSRLSSLLVIGLPFVPEVYRKNLATAHPADFSNGWFNQNIGYTGLVLLAATSLYVVQRLIKKDHVLYQLETDKLKLELNHLKSQVQPHFFFNTLNNLYSLSVQGATAQAAAMIANLSDIMRYVLYESQQERVLLAKEVAFIKSYIDLERIRHTDPHIIDFAVQGNLDDLKIEPLLLLPLIENTFKHGLQKNLAAKQVKLVLSIDEDELFFQTINQKEATPPTKVDNQGGIGLENVRKRLALLYPRRHQLEVFDEETTFTTTLSIQLTAVLA